MEGLAMGNALNFVLDSGEFLIDSLQLSLLLGL